MKSNSEEFIKLKELISAKKVELRLKRFIKDPFGIWIYYICKTKLSSLYLFYIYWPLLNVWVWFSLSIFLAFKLNWVYILLFLVPILLKRLLKPIGQGLILADVEINEEMLNGLWQSKAIVICSTNKIDSVIHKGGVPSFIINSHDQNWRYEISQLDM
ncbi:MAG: hypothetical protein NTX85_01925 [Candidatus Nomurabacteria bacterium]|nr:hypothetical protein [Candidatus Nomurabacteria bacterium]